MTRNYSLSCTAVVFIASSSMNAAFAAPPLDFEVAPINYTEATPHDAVALLQKELDAGTKTLKFDKEYGYLKSMLQELNVPVSSQMLTFSKTSMQRPRINPQNPRSLYFNDDAYVGFVREGIIEMIVTDPKLGLSFYTLEQDPVQPNCQRQVSRCMTCHSSSRTKSVPGLMVRSMFVDPKGQPVVSAGSFRTDHSSPITKRWGGWYVTGTHGETEHMGNFQLPSSKRPKKPVVNSTGQNITDLSNMLDVSTQLSPHSDIVALMVFEHQVDAHNYMIRANYAWQIDHHNGVPEDEEAIWKRETEQLLEHLLFANEAKLTHEIKGTSSFTADFTARGPFDSTDQSLRQFDLKNRLFKFPCSYMIHSKMFRSLPEPVRNRTYVRLLEVLSNEQGKESKFASLSMGERKNLIRLLQETIPEFKQVWQRQVSQIPN